MSVLIIGGDRLGRIPDRLSQLGVTEITHVTGRKIGNNLSDIPRYVDVVLVLTDYVSHGLAVKIKSKARERGVKTLFVRRSWVHIQQDWEKMLHG